MKAKHSVWKSKLAKTMFLMTVVLVAALFLGTAASAAIRPQETKTQNSIPVIALDAENKEYIARADGLSPLVTKGIPTQHAPLLDRGYFYAYNAYDPSGAHPEGPITFDTPDAIESLQAGIVPNFIGGADIDADGNWYGVEYGGGIYHIDYDGTMTLMGPSPGMNGLCFDSTTATWYGTGGGSLYTVDVLTGTSTVVGSHGIANTLIGLICDNSGDIYGYDVLFSGMSHLYSVDKASGAATDLGALNIGFLYAQDPAYDRDNEIFYIAGYTQSGTAGLYTLDGLTCTLVGAFEGGMEVDGFAIPWLPFQYDHDIAISGIVKPASGNAGPITPIVKVKNIGLNTETNVQIKLDIGVEVVTGTVEDFEATNGSYIHAPKLPQPDAWQWGAPTSGPMAAHNGANVWATNLAGNYPASMWCYLVTPTFTVPSGALFNFWHWYYFENNYDGGNVKISNDGGTTWTIITPVGGYPGSMAYNPYMTGQAAYNGQSGGWKQANFDLSAYEGQDCKIMFETASDSSVQYTGWYIDDVGFTIISWQNEYSQTVTVPSIAPDTTLEVSFPTWTPAALGVSENVNINYNAEATNLFVDENTQNDYKEKAFTLHYGYLHDVAITEIVSPQNGLAQTQTPEVVIFNKGQNAESVNVHMTIGKALYTTLLEEDFSGGVPPAGWGTNYPSNWMSSSTNYAGGVAPEAYFTWSPSSVGEHRLYTMDIDTTGYTALLLKFKEYVNDYNGDYDLKIQTSIDSGATWSDAYVRAGGPYGPATTEVALTAANGVGSATFRIAWDMSGDSFNINYWYVDDAWLGIIDMVEEYDETVTVDVVAGETVNAILPDWTPSDVPFAENIDYLVDVEATLNGFAEFYTYGFEDWVPTVPPQWQPPGWMIYNVNTGNAWVRSTTGQRSGVGCAKCTYDYAVQPNDDWLATGPVVVAPGGIFELWVDTYNYGDDEYEIYMSTTGNTPADFLSGTMLAGVYYPVPGVYTQYTFDMSAYVGQTVYFAIRYIGWYAWYIWVDDVTLPDGTFVGFEDAGTPEVPGYFPGWSQYTISGTDVDNKFDGVQSGTYPTCTPHGGSWMARYACWYISSGNSKLFVKDNSFDFTTADGYAMRLWMYHDTGYSGTTDRITVCASPDGANFYLLETINRYDGSTGWKQHSIGLSAFAGLPAVWIGFYGESFYGNNIFFDDLSLLEASLMDDGYPADNVLGKIITLSYEHDAGVIAITEPSGSAPKDEGWLQYDNGVYANAFGSTTGQIYGANRFTIDEQTPYIGWDLDMIRWKHYGAVAFSGNVHIYSAGSATAPGAEITTEPFSITGDDWFEVPLSSPVTLDGSDIWLCVEGTHNTGEYPLECSAPGITLKTAFFSSDGATWYDLPGLGYDVAFEIRGHVTSGGGGDEYWLPGTYPVEGIIQNLGVTFPEIDIPVNAQITNDTGVIVYDETVVVAGPVAPGGTAVVTFPDITIPEDPDAEGDYKLTMKTVLPGDDHPNNDKKTLSWIIRIPDTTPPTTEATLAGTMGQSEWYVSSVTVTLTAYDEKWPEGVDYTMYKVDNGEWTLYETPFQVTTDGQHTVYFYSVDKAVPPNTEEEKSISFKMDKTAPVINAFTATAQNGLKTKWLLEADATDATSGIVKVEFYADDALVGEDTDGAPYEFLVESKIHTAQCIVYDAAGNSKMSDVVTSFDYGNQQQYYTLLKQL